MWNNLKIKFLHHLQFVFKTNDRKDGQKTARKYDKYLKEQL